MRICSENVEKRKKQGHSHEDACNLTSIELAQSAVAHCRAFIVQSSYETIKDINREVSPALGKVLHQLLELYAVTTCMRSVGDLLMVNQRTKFCNDKGTDFFLKLLFASLPI